MRYVKQNRIYTIYEIRQENPNMSIPDGADCSSLGFEFLEEVEEPKQEGFYAVEVAPINNKQTWKLLPIVKTSDELRDEAMLQGAEYNGYQISFTKDDGDGLMQVKTAFELGLTETVIHFDCGTKMPMRAEDFKDFALWFVSERNKFFVVGRQ